MSKIIGNNATLFGGGLIVVYAFVTLLNSTVTDNEQAFMSSPLLYGLQFRLLLFVFACASW